MFVFYAWWIIGSVLAAAWFSVGFVGKAIRAQSYVEYALRPIFPEACPWLDRAVLDALTRELSELGFIHLADTTAEARRIAEPSPDEGTGVTAAAPPIPLPYGAPGAPTLPEEASAPLNNARSFARVFGHPGYGCFATVIGSYTPTQAGEWPLRTGIMSQWNADSGWWTYGTTNREPKATSWVIRGPRSLSTRMVGANAAQMLATHLQKRDEISARLDAAPGRDVSWENYVRFEQRNGEWLRETTRTRNAVVATWELMTFRFGRHDEWMGDLSKK